MIDSERIKSLLSDRQWTQSDLARYVGVSPSAISQVVKGKTQNSRLIPKISKILGVSPSYLTGETDDPFETVEGSITPRELANTLKVRLSGTTVLGLMDDELDDDHKLLWPFDIDWVVSKIKNFHPPIEPMLKEDDFFPPVHVISAATDAMAPLINKDDEVMISMWHTEVNQPDAIWLFKYGGLAMIRRLMPLPNDRGYRVYADNTASPTFEAPFKDIEVLGRAFWVGKPIS